MKCKCGSKEFWWNLDGCNECGWKCAGCDAKPGEPPGFCPQCDREEIGGKVYTILMELHEAEFLYVSNGSMGEGMVGAVARRCRETGVYDQQSIMALLLEASDLESQPPIGRRLARA